MKVILFCLALILAWNPALAAPRIGKHPTYTRLVFDLPKNTTQTNKRMGNKLVIQLKLKLPNEKRSLTTAPGITGYKVVGTIVSVTLKPKIGKPKIMLLPSTTTTKARLVIDVPLSPTKSTFAKTTSHRKQPVVVIDPGHGGIDPGMTSKWLKEKDITLKVGLKLRQRLQKQGVKVIMTRVTDKHISKNKVVDLDARSNMAKTGKVSAFISIHVNASTNTRAHGVETYYFGHPIGGKHRSIAVRENGGGSTGRALTRKSANMSQRMLGDILAQAKLSFSRQLAHKVQSRLVSHTGALNRGVHKDAFYVIRNPRTAAILVEIGFGSNANEAQLLIRDAYQNKVAHSLSQSILDFLNVK